LFSSYKYKPTAMCLIGISPNGLAQLRSPIYGGSSSETSHLLNSSRLIERIREIAGDDLPEENLNDIAVQLEIIESYNVMKLPALKLIAEQFGIATAKKNCAQLLPLVRKAHMDQQVVPLTAPFLMGDGAYARINLKLARYGMHCLLPSPIPSDGSAISPENALASSQLSTQRGLVERVVKMVKTEEMSNVTVTQAVTAEKRLDIYMALHNLKLLGKLDRLEEIPMVITDEIRSKYFNPFTDAELPPRTVLKKTAERDVPKSLKKLIDMLPSLTWDDLVSFVENDRKKPLERGLSHVKSGHVLKHSLGLSSSGTLLIQTESLASFRKDTVYTTISEWNGKQRLNHFCNCCAGITCSHEAEQGIDIFEYVNRNNLTNDRKGKFLCVRPNRQANLLSTSRFYPLHYIADNIIGSLGSAFIVSPVLLSKGCPLFKPSKEDWKVIKANREARKVEKAELKKVGERPLECLCHPVLDDDGPIVLCKGCHRPFHRICLIRKRISLTSFYCESCYSDYVVISRPPIISFEQMRRLADEKGVEMRLSKKASALKKKSALQGNVPKDIHHHVGVVATQFGNKKRKVTAAEEDVMDDLDAEEVDLDHAILGNGDLYESEDDGNAGEPDVDEEGKESDEESEEIASADSDDEEDADSRSESEEAEEGSAMDIDQK
jgi:hypothetical protein